MKNNANDGSYNHHATPHHPLQPSRLPHHASTTAVCPMLSPSPLPLSTMPYHHPWSNLGISPPVFNYQPNPFNMLPLSFTRLPLPVQPVVSIAPTQIAIPRPPVSSHVSVSQPLGNSGSPCINSLADLHKVHSLSRSSPELSHRDSVRYHRRLTDRKRSPDRMKTPDRKRSPKRRSSPDRGSVEQYFERKRLKVEKTEQNDIPVWIRSSPSDLYFLPDARTCGDVRATQRHLDLEEEFQRAIVGRSQRARSKLPPVKKPERVNPNLGKKRCCHDDCSSDSESDAEGADVADSWLEELELKKRHPERMHEELWFNELGEMNDGPLCRCSVKSSITGIRHNIYPGEQTIPQCDPETNNSQRLYHYRISMSPATNFLTKDPTVIMHDGHEYIFEGFSLFSHQKVEGMPPCTVIRFNIKYTVHWFEEPAPKNFSIKSLDLLTQFIFYEILELVDLDWNIGKDGCSLFHVLPRFARCLPENGKEILSINEILSYLLHSSDPLIEESEIDDLKKYDHDAWQMFVDTVRGSIVTQPGKRPSSVRIDQLDKEHTLQNDRFPVIVHFGIRPAQLSYAGDPQYLKLWKQLMKFQHLLSNKPKVSAEDRQVLQQKEDQLQELRLKGNMKREATVELSSKGFIKTGIKADVCQHAMLLPVLIGHIRFHRCLSLLEKRIDYSFHDRTLLQLALTHPSYRIDYGTNPDHARNSLTNCGIRQPEYGNKKVFHVTSRKRGINTLINIMARMGKNNVTLSEVNHYERLEFLGDAVVEFVTSTHLFYMFPNLEEGGLATYRSSIVQNQNLALLADKLKLQNYMLFAHGPDLCQNTALKHAMANCFEALMGALFLDGGIELADEVFSKVLFDSDELQLQRIWIQQPRHLLQIDQPDGDRHWIESSPILQRMLEFEELIGVEFNHVRLLARSFTLRNVGFNNLTLGHNQRLEFLGDTVIQLVASQFLYLHFPEHHEGHLSLLRSTLVNNKTQAVVCDDLGMTDFLINGERRTVASSSQMRFKEKADLLESFIGALFVDKGLEYCQTFCNVCFFPRLEQFIMNQDWNDPKSQLQQCCLTLRDLDGDEPEIPIYKVISSSGPTNTRVYTVAVYFQAQRLAKGTGRSIQMAEMDAARSALKEKSALFPHLNYQRAYIEKRYGRRDGSPSRSGKDCGRKRGGRNERMHDKSDRHKRRNDHNRDDIRHRSRDQSRERSGENSYELNGDRSRDRNRDRPRDFNSKSNYYDRRSQRSKSNEKMDDGRNEKYFNHQRTSFEGQLCKDNSATIKTEFRGESGKSAECLPSTTSSNNNTCNEINAVGIERAEDKHASQLYRLRYLQN